jgi:hypothetical protein
MAQQQSVSAAAIQKFLKGVRYPTNKHKLIFMAEENDAPPEVLEMLHAELSDDTRYEGPNQVQQEVFGSDDDDDDEQPQRGREDDRGTQSRRRQADRGDDDPDPSRVSSQRRQQISRDEEREYEERRRGRERDTSVDHRKKGNETDAISDARHMRHGYDGRGQVRRPDDHRLRGKETPELFDARHMLRGYDGRGVFRGDKEGKEFEGNKAATGGKSRKPLYKMTPEERRRHNRERLQQLRLQEEEGSGNGRGQQTQDRGQQRHEQDMRGTDPKELIIDYIEDARDQEADIGDIYDFCEDNGIHENVGELLRELRDEGAVHKTGNSTYAIGPEEGRRSRR